jgi:hypothetical protein
LQKNNNFNEIFLRHPRGPKSLRRFFRDRQSDHCRCRELVLKAAPDAIAHFEKILALLPQVANTTVTATIKAT